MYCILVLQLTLLKKKILLGRNLRSSCNCLILKETSSRYSACTVNSKDARVVLQNLQKSVCIVPVKFDTTLNLLRITDQ